MCNLSPYDKILLFCGWVRRNMPKVSLRLLVGSLLIVAAGCSSANGRTSLPALKNPELTAMKLGYQAQDLDPKVLRLALKAYNHARVQGYDNKQVLTVIDYSKPSNQHRFWVFDLSKEKLLYDELVSHGRNSGNATAMAFSNRPNSLQSSIGVYATGNPYIGEHGYSLRLNGLEPGFNDNAYSRAIVIHGAWYVSQKFAQEHGRVGRSWGCPALDQRISKPIIDIISHDTLLVAY